MRRNVNAGLFSMRQSRCRLRVMVGMFVVCVLVSGCGASEDTDRQDSINFLAGGDEFRKFRQRYDRRVSDLVDLCLRRAGFDPGIFSEDFGPPLPEVTPEDTNYYGIVDNLKLMQHHNETLSPKTTVIQVSPMERSAYDEALNGTDRTPGCSQEAETTADSEFRIPEVEAIGSLIEEIRVDSGVADAYQRRVDEWSLCMKEEGIDGLVDPTGINSLVYEQWRRDLEDGDNSDRSLRLERSIYLAEQNCPTLKGSSPLEKAAEQLLESHPDVEELLKQITSD